jgi:hypothetical protein
MSLIDLIKDNIPQIVEFVDKAESLFLYFEQFCFPCCIDCFSLVMYMAK